MCWGWGWRHWLAELELELECYSDWCWYVCLAVEVAGYFDSVSVECSDLSFGKRYEEVGSDFDSDFVVNFVGDDLYDDDEKVVKWALEIATGDAGPKYAPAPDPDSRSDRVGAEFELEHLPELLARST